MYIVAMMSGKGGVGKTTTCLGTALALSEMGYRVAILDLDLENPSMAGRDGATGLVRDDLNFPGELIQPPRWYGIPVMSLSLLPLADFEDTPTMLEEDQKHFLIRELFKEVDWGDTEILIVDMPPGSGEEVRGLMQLDLAGVVVITSPQRISEAAVRKVLVMAEEYRIPVFGILENSIYGVPGEAGENLAEQFKLPLLARVEWNERILRSMEEHVAFDSSDFDPVAEALAAQLLQTVPVTLMRRDELERARAEERAEEETADLAEEPWRAWRDLEDSAWKELEPLIPPRTQAGAVRIDDRAMLNGMLWVYTTRESWNQMPERYGKWETAKKRMHRWKKAGFWDPIWEKSKELGYVMTEAEFDQFIQRTNDDEGVLRAGDDPGEPVRIGGEGPAEVSRSEPAERPAEGADAATADS